MAGVTTADINGFRHLLLDGAINFRDLGGYRAAGGRAIRPRLLFRSDGLGALTDTDLDQLTEIGLRTVVDLRTTTEVEHSRFPYERHPVAYHHLSLLDRTWDPAMARGEGVTTTSFLHGAYSAMLVEGAERFATAFRLLVAPGALPAVFHCAAGKDRTGLLAALILGSLGVDDDTVVADYELTQRIMPTFLARLMSEDSERAETARTHPQAFFQADGPALRLLLADIRRAPGSTRGFVESIGVEPIVLDTLAGLVLEPA